MKKIMIFSIILMPLIVLGIMFLSGSIVKMSTYLYVEYIEFVDDEIVLNKTSGENVSHALKVNVFPVLANNKEVEFWSANENIVSVDENGNLTSRDFGSTYVYAKSKENGAKQATCKVVVTSEKVHKIWAENSVSTMYVGSTHRFNVKYAPLEAKEVSFNITSSNPSALYVSQDGELVAKAKGASTITISLKSDPNITCSFDVDVKVKAEGIWIEDSSSVTSAKTSFSFPEIKFSPSTAEEKISYFSSDSSIATVNSEGQIQFLKRGTVVITAKAENVNDEVTKSYTSTFGYFKNVSFSTLNERELNFEDWQNSDLNLIWTGFPEDGNLENISLVSSNESVVKVENGKLKVVGGGEATITIVAKTSEMETTTASITLNVNRKIDSISFDRPNFSFVSSRAIDLATAFPADATERIEYEISNTEIATVENGKLVFSSAVLNNKCGKVSITAKTKSGLAKTITVVYLDSSVQRIDLENQDQLNLTLPKTGEPSLSFAVVSTRDDLNDLSLKIESGSDVLTQNGYIFTLKNNGSAEIGVYFNGETNPSKRIGVSVKKDVEEIQNIKVFATWEGLDSKQYSSSERIYSSSKVFEISYNLFPSGTTKTEADLEIVSGDAAQIVDGKICFVKAGKVRVRIFADQASEEFEIESTFMLPNENTVVTKNVEIFKGSSISIWSLIEVLPENADRNNITFQTSSTSISIDENGNIFGVCGGEAKIEVSIPTPNQTISKEINVFVKENAEKVVVLGNEIEFITNQTYNFKNKFKVYPETANLKTQITFGVENENVAYINSEGNLVFKEAGRCVVYAKLENDFVARISVAYVGNSLVLRETTANVLEGTKFVVIPSSEVLSNAKYSDDFIPSSENISVSNGLFITVLGNGEVTFAGETYSLNCVKKITNVSISAENALDINLRGGKNITGLSSLKLVGNVFGAQSEFIETTFASSKLTVATISQTGVLSFNSAGEVEITFEAKFVDSVLGANKILHSTKIKIQSTFGEINEIVPSQTGKFEFTIDDENPINNIINICSYVNSFPTQVSMTSENVKLVLSNNLLANVNGLEIQFVKGGILGVEIQIKQGDKFVLASKIEFEIKKNAEAIYVNEKEIVNMKTYSWNKSTLFLNPVAFPEDSNINNKITWEVVENNGVAEVDASKNKIVFKKTNETISIKFTLGENENIKEFVVYLKATTITFEVDVESETFVVPSKEPFTFVSSEGEILNLIVNFGSEFASLRELSEGVYVIDESCVGNVLISVDGNERTVKLVSTSNINKIENVGISDVKMNGETEVVSAIENGLSLVTASKEVGIEYIVPVGYNKLGNLISCQIATSNSEIATIDGTKVVFKKAGIAKITLTIAFDDAYGEKSIAFSFEIRSTFGNIEEFNVPQDSYSFLYDELEQSELTFDILSSLTRVSPSYGEVSLPEVSINNNSVIKFINNKFEIVGSGTAKIEIKWGNATKIINVGISKQIDGLKFVDNGQPLTQIVIKTKTYNLNYEILATNSAFAPTLRDVEITVVGNATINGKVLTFNEVNEKCVVTVKAKDGNATANLVVVCVSEDVNVISATSSLNRTVVKAGETNIFNFDFGETFVELLNPSNDSIVFNSTLGTFKVTKGLEGQLQLSNGQIITIIATQEVGGINFKTGAWESGKITALGSSSDGKGIDLNEIYGASISPVSARTEAGAYVVEILVDDPSIAYVENGFLYFIKQGEVTLTFKAGNVEEKRKIESTLGFAKSVEFENADGLQFEFTTREYVLPENMFSVFPSDAYIIGATFKSLDESVFKVENGKLIFVDGGTANLELSVEISRTETISITKEVYVVNRATGIDFFDGEIKVGRIVKNAKPNSTMVLSYVINSVGVLSPYNVVFESSNESVATIANGIVTFVGNGTTTITVKVQSKLNDETQFDAVASLKIVNNENYEIKSITQADNEIYLESESANLGVIYPKFNMSDLDFEFVQQSGLDVVSIGENGEINKISGGEATVLIRAEGFEKLVTIYVHKRTGIILEKENVVTSKTNWKIGVEFSPSDSLSRKTINYVSSDENVATVENGNIVFLKEGSVVITINVVYNGEIETSKQFKIRSTFGKVESFNIDVSSWTLKNGESKVISISNVYPSDFSGELSISSNNETAFKLEKLSEISFKVEGLKRGTGTIVVKFSGSDSFAQNVSIEVKQISTSVEFQQNGKTVSSIKSFANVVDLTAIVKPFDSNETAVEWEVESGNATVSENGQVTFVVGAYGEAVIVAKAKDGGSQGKITITYVQEIDGFNISHSGKTVASGGTVFLGWNVNDLILGIEILPATLKDFNMFEYFTITSSNGSTAQIDENGKIQIATLSHETNPSFTDVITIKYKDLYTKTINIIRDGIQRVDFGNHDNELDSTYGLQQMRLFGNRSYYDGIQNYYRMTVNVYPNNNLSSNIIWETSNSNVSVVNANGYADIYFNSISGSTVQEIYDDDFSKGEITVYAKNQAGELLYSYTFHIVNAVNVFDQAGYVNGGSEIVLQKSLGHDDQAALIEKGSYARLDAYAAKTTIFGNGFLINFAHRNKDTSEASYTNYENIQVNIKNAINLTIQGSNYDSTRESYNIELTGTEKLSYCEIYYMYRSVEKTSGNIYVKRCLFRTFKSSGIIGSANDTKNLYLEDIIMFDVGTRAIELQKNGTAYLKGFIDVYNFQNKDAIKEYTSIGASTIINRFNAGNMVVEVNGEKWVNMVGISSKGTDLKIYYYNYDTGEYEYKENGDHTSAYGLTRITYGLGSLGITAWSYTNGSQPHLTYANEFKDDGSLNVEYMISTVPKIKRLTT